MDAEIRRKFAALLRYAVRGQLKKWEANPKSALALIILLDQFSLNLHHEQPEGYLQSRLAIPIARRLIARNETWTLTPAERVFVYLPLEHSENLADQAQCVALMKACAKGAPAICRKDFAGFVDFALRHYRVVKQFGRFPDRNDVFGRKSTPRELRFLEKTPHGF